MNWGKCQKTWNCKVCSDYNYCKDDIKNTKIKKSRRHRNESKSKKKLSRQNNKQMV